MPVPPGTVIRDLDSGELLGEIVEAGQEMRIARGGRGGKGNSHFATATHQTPLEFQPGEDGEARTLELELKLIADVGLVGQPNAGKSTLLSVISAARPKIADYPFTTLVPNLGIVQAPEEHKSFVVADIPGLIEGASGGKGLGLQFLRHIERSRVLLFLLDGTSEDPAPREAYKILKKELENYSPALLSKPRLIAISKSDAIGEDEQKSLARLTIDKQKPILISAVSGDNIDLLIRRLWDALAKSKEAG
jgi:GTPase